MKSVPLIALLTLLAGTLTASMTDPRMPIWMSGSAINVDTLRGSGIVIAPGIESKPWPVLGGEIAWRKADDMIDPIGMRHVFYRQFYISSATKVAAQLAGAEVGIHFDKKGKLTFVGGNQFADFALANALRIERADVQAHARALVSGVAGFQLPPIVSVTTAELNALDTETRLLLASDGSSSDFRYVWTALVRDATHETYSVDMDADTGKLLRVGVRFGTNNCTPSNPTVQYSAIGIPTRTDVAASGVVRSLAVSPTSDRPAPFVYEGHMQPGYQTPAINTFQVVTDPTYLCQPQYSPDYSLFPLRDTRYDNYGDQWLGRVAGDATYFTNIAMATFRSFGVCGFDRSCATTASISVNAPPYIDNATYTTIASQYAPAWSVIIGTTQAFPYPLAVALDAVAHEWGHLSLESRGFRYNDCQTAQQWGISCDEWNAVHEGFGDVMGHSAEKKFQPAGTGPETSTDWTIGEDIGCDGGAGYLRSAGTYDWQGHSACGYSFNDTFHASDPYGAPPQDVHSRGNMLAVAFKMMTDGGSNPACVVGLGCNSTPAVGIEASNILYRTFTYYLTAGTFRWSQIGNYAVRAAYDFYNTCTSPFPPNDPATTEQNSVRTAFGNIGYPATSTCTCSQGCTQ